VALTFMVGTLTQPEGPLCSQDAPLAYNFHVFVDFWFVGAKYVATASTFTMHVMNVDFVSSCMRSMACTEVARRSSLWGLA